MTIAVSVKVGDGIALATDSAASMVTVDGSGIPQIGTVYNNANKILNLRKGLPLGIMCCGVGGVGDVSLGVLLKVLRERFTKGEPGGPWRIDPDSYKVRDVAEKVMTFLVDEHVSPWIQAGNQWSGLMQLIVAGFSSDELIGEIYEIWIDEHGQGKGPNEISGTGTTNALHWAGQPEAIYRLVYGVDPTTASALTDHLGIPDPQASVMFEALKANLGRDLFMSAMPIQDAIDLAEFLADMSAKYSRFRGGHATVGGPIEIAAMTKHEGFKWVRRKYYYDRKLNPEEVER